MEVLIMAKMSDPKLDALFEKMSKGTVDKITGTYPRPKKTSTKKKTVTKKKVK